MTSIPGPSSLGKCELHRHQHMIRRDGRCFHIGSDRDRDLNAIGAGVGSGLEFVSDLDVRVLGFVGRFGEGNQLVADRRRLLRKDHARRSLNGRAHLGELVQDSAPAASIGLSTDQVLAQFLLQFAGPGLA